MERMSIKEALEHLDTVDGASATYCPEDNKLRLYCGRVPREDYEALRSLGFTSTPKQGCDFVAVWTPYREDAALAMIEPGDDIGDEDQSPEDRAADRAERFAGYRDKRRGEATGHADTFEAGPSVHGHQNAQRAERAAARHDRQRVRAVSQWSKAEYWQTRTQGVIGNALYRSSARVRRGRIVRLEKELAQMDRRNERNPNELYGPRWSEHYTMRLEYERQMLESQGGAASDLVIEIGGTFGGYVVAKVNKSPTTGRIVSISTYVRKSYGDKTMTFGAINIERLGEDAYTPPTDESRAKLAELKATAQAERREVNAGKPKLVNPTNEDAERLQAILNEGARMGADRYISTIEPSQVRYMTQAEYSDLSKGTYARYGTQNLQNDGSTRPTKYVATRPVVCKMRIGPRTSKSSLYNADAVVVLTDKPQKPIPQLDTIAANVEAMKAEKVTA